jgi:hypothetical protein
VQLFKTIFLDSAVFIKKKRWGIEGGEKVKFGGEKKYIIVFMCVCA